MKKTTFAVATLSLLAAQAIGGAAFAQTPTGPTNGTNRAPSLPAGSAAKPAGEGSGAMAPSGADGTTKAPSSSTMPAARSPGTVKPGGEGSSAMAPSGADGTPKAPAASAGSKDSRKMARTARSSRMKAANKDGEIASPTVNPKSY